MRCLRWTRHHGRSLAARSIASVVAGGRSLGADRERRELTRGKAVGMHELDVQMERLRVFGYRARRAPDAIAGGRADARRIFRQLTLTLSFAGNLPQRRIARTSGSPARHRSPAAPEIAKPCVNCSIRDGARPHCARAPFVSDQVLLAWTRSTPIAATGLSRRRIYSNKPTLSPQPFGSLRNCRIVLTTDIHRYMHANLRGRHRSLLTPAFIRAGLPAQGDLS